MGSLNMPPLHLAQIDDSPSTVIIDDSTIQVRVLIYVPVKMYLLELFCSFQDGWIRAALRQTARILTSAAASTATTTTTTKTATRQQQQKTLHRLRYKFAAGRY
jgi:hypothetical protein